MFLFWDGVILSPLADTGLTRDPRLYLLSSRTLVIVRRRRTGTGRLSHVLVVVLAVISKLARGMTRDPGIVFLWEVLILLGIMRQQQHGWRVNFYAADFVFLISKCCLGFILLFPTFLVDD